MSAELLTTKQAANRLGLAAGTLHLWRHLGRYKLKFVRLGRAVRYRPEDLDEFVAERTNVPPLPQKMGKPSPGRPRKKSRNSVRQ
jgi:excisionase family DNA binding protein